MSEVDHEVVLLDVLADEVVLQMLLVFDREFDFALGIHDIDGGDGSEAVVLDGLEMGFGRRTLAGVGRVALHDGAVHLLHQILDESRLEEVVAARLTGTNLDSNLAGGLATQGFVNLHEGGGGNLRRHIHFRLGGDLHAGGRLDRESRHTLYSSQGSQSREGRLHPGSSCHCFFHRPNVF